MLRCLWREFYPMDNQKIIKADNVKSPNLRLPANRSLNTAVWQGSNRWQQARKNKNGKIESRY